MVLPHFCLCLCLCPLAPIPYTLTTTPIPTQNLKTQTPQPSTFSPSPSSPPPGLRQSTRATRFWCFQNTSKFPGHARNIDNLSYYSPKGSQTPSPHRARNCGFHPSSSTDEDAEQTRIQYSSRKCIESAELLRSNGCLEERKPKTNAQLRLTILSNPLGPPGWAGLLRRSDQRGKNKVQSSRQKKLQTRSKCASNSELQKASTASVDGASARPKPAPPSLSFSSGSTKSSPSSTIISRASGRPKLTTRGNDGVGRKHFSRRRAQAGGGGLTITLGLSPRHLSSDRE